MKSKINDIKLRMILDSNAQLAIEAEIFLEADAKCVMGRGSSPAAIVPGKREKRISDIEKQKQLESISLVIKEELNGRTISQKELDNYLKEKVDIIGTTICLAISIAFARATSVLLGISLMRLFNKQYACKLKKIPNVLIPVFSGGVHQKDNKGAFQQIMVCLRQKTLSGISETSKKISDCVERKLVEIKKYNGIASSGGFLSIDLSTEEKLKITQSVILELGISNYASIAVDIAAEHLVWDSLYHLDGRGMSARDFFEIIMKYIREFDICYVEDPFDTQDIDYWKKVMSHVEKNVDVVGDDLFATQVDYIDPMLANCIVIKMNQVGTLSDTFDAVKVARRLGMNICVSHRSRETEDTTMCDLAMAIAAEYVKIGSTRRGERILKYNQLIRLEEELNYDYKGGKEDELYT